MKILQTTRSSSNILNPTFEAFTLLLVYVLAGAAGGWKGATPCIQSLQLSDFTSLPTKPQRNNTDNKQASLGHHHMAAQQEQTTTMWDTGILKGCLKSWELTKSFCTFGKRKWKKKPSHVSTVSQALTAFWGLLQVLVLLQLCLSVLLTNTSKWIPTLPAEKAEL